MNTLIGAFGHPDSWHTLRLTLPSQSLAPPGSFFPFLTSELEISSFLQASKPHTDSVSQGAGCTNAWEFYRLLFSAGFTDKTPQGSHLGLCSSVSDRRGSFSCWRALLCELREPCLLSARGVEEPEQCGHDLGASPVSRGLSFQLKWL